MGLLCILHATVLLMLEVAFTACRTAAVVLCCRLQEVQNSMLEAFEAEAPVSVNQGSFWQNTLELWQQGAQVGVCLGV